MKNKTYETIKKLERITLAIDLAVIITFITVFVSLFNLMNVPEEPPVEVTLYVYQFFGITLGTNQVNFIMSLIAIILVVVIPVFVVNLKKQRIKDLYDYDQWLAGNTFIIAIVSLFGLNPFSFVLRVIITSKILNMTLGYGTIKWTKLKIEQFKQWYKVDRKIKKPKEEETELSRVIRKQSILKILRIFGTYFFLSIFALFIFIPFYWMILTALKTYHESNIALKPSIFIPLSEMQWVNFKYVLSKMDFNQYIINTLIVGAWSTLGTLITTILAAFAFARMDFKGREMIFSVLLMTMMIPGELFIITNFITVSQRGFGWVGGPTGTNQYFLAMIIPFMTSVFYVFFLRQTFKQIPESLYRAAQVDGCGDFKYLTRVMIPIAGPTIFTITILNVLGSWNAFIWPRLITGVGGSEGQQYWLISAALRDADFTTGGVDARIMFNIQIAASALVTIPLIIIFLALRKYIMSGVGRSGTKG